jgi:hypothetical protein
LTLSYVIYDKNLWEDMVADINCDWLYDWCRCKDQLLNELNY